MSKTLSANSFFSHNDNGLAHYFVHNKLGVGGTVSIFTGWQKDRFWSARVQLTGL